MKQFLLIVLVLIISCGTNLSSSTGMQRSETIYHLDVSDPTKDIFNITVLAPTLTAENNIYNFASTAPGTYDVLDFGRFVKSFSAFDVDGNKIDAKKISTNKYEFSEPEKVYKLVYELEDTFDTEIKERGIAPMGGTEIDSDHVLINTFGVFGYFEGFQSSPSKVKLTYPKKWLAGTALNMQADGYYHAETYDHLADSPILLGTLTKEVIKVNDIDVEIFVYSSKNAIVAKDVLEISKDVLQAASKFISYSPVNRYTFLFDLLDNETVQRNTFPGMGALEHSYSSAYVLPADKRFMPQLKDIMAHEFFHIITPLNIHSEVIETYNFATPIASEHLWLYEGVTEWASQIMQLRSSQKTFEEYLADVSSKMTANINNYDENYPLATMSLNAYKQKGQEEYGNIYQKGALVAGLLDIKLLELSEGKKGLRELVIELSKEYGKNKAFDDKTFFDVIVQKTYPQIRDFINKYIRGGESLPLEEYYGKLGISYTEKILSENKRPQFGAFLAPVADGIIIRGFAQAHENYGLKVGDKIVEIFGEEINAQKYNEVFDKTKTMKAGDKFTVKVEREGEIKSFEGQLFNRYRYHILKSKDDPSTKELTLRDRWMKNFKL